MVASIQLQVARGDHGGYCKFCDIERAELVEHGSQCQKHITMSAARFMPGKSREK